MDRLNKSGSFNDLKMISFDLRTALFTYAKGHTASITYTPQDDSYMVSFESANGESPHEILAPLLSHRLNELAGGPKDVVKGTTGKQFISVSPSFGERSDGVLMDSFCAIRCPSLWNWTPSKRRRKIIPTSLSDLCRTSGWCGMFRIPDGEPRLPCFEVSR